MTLIEFLSLGIKQGQKVTLHLKDSNKAGTVTVRAFFFGFRFEAYSSVAYKPEQIIPVFNKVAKNGKMLRAHIDQSTWPEYIEYIETDDNAQTLDSDTACSLLNATENLEQAAKRQVRGILKEMNTLFPGKRILLGPDTYEVKKDQPLVFEKGWGVYITDWTYALLFLLQAFKDPYEPEDEEEDEDEGKGEEEGTGNGEE